MRCVIKFLVKRNKKATEIYEELQSVHQEQRLSRESVYYWFRQFKTFGRENVGDVNQYIQAVCDIIEGDRQASAKGIALSLGISRPRYHSP